MSGLRAMQQINNAPVNQIKSTLNQIELNWVFSELPGPSNKKLLKILFKDENTTQTQTHINSVMALCWVYQKLILQ